jgi:hypothetical protein
MLIINIQYQNENWIVQNFVSPFSQESIQVTDNARKLLVFAIQSQVEEDLMVQLTLFNRFDAISSQSLLNY